ncbi:hypothetical protein LPJ59_005145 [Coemansia sp. RSA 2399]|nr:hypothetical protein LPJ59_005145 [Coemansia sp. RSA 2399]
MTIKTNDTVYCWFYVIGDDGMSMRCVPHVVYTSDAPEKILASVLSKMGLGDQRYVVFSNIPETSKITTFGEYGFKHRDKVFLIPAERESMYHENLAMIRSREPESCA